MKAAGFRISDSSYLSRSSFDEAAGIVGGEDKARLCPFICPRPDRPKREVPPAPAERMILIGSTGATLKRPFSAVSVNLIFNARPD